MQFPSVFICRKTARGCCILVAPPCRAQRLRSGGLGTFRVPGTSARPRPADNSPSWQDLRHISSVRNVGPTLSQVGTSTCGLHPAAGAFQAHSTKYEHRIGTCPATPPLCVYSNPRLNHASPRCTHAHVLADTMPRNPLSNSGVLDAGEILVTGANAQWIFVTS